MNKAPVPGDESGAGDYHADLYVLFSDDIAYDLLSIADTQTVTFGTNQNGTPIARAIGELGKDLRLKATLSFVRPSHGKDS